MAFDVAASAPLVAVLLLIASSVTVVSDPELEDAQAIAEEILALEDSAMEQWRQGNPMRWVEISADEVTYIDPSLTAPVVGKDAYTRYLEPLKGTIFYDGSEYVDPRVAIHGDTAVLTYTYHSLRNDDDGRPQRTSFWNTTEVYHRFGEEWRIIHTHWSYIQHRLPDNLVMSIPVQMREAAPRTGAAAKIMALEATAMERWRKGEPYGFLDLSAPHVSYFDTATPARLDGLERLKAKYDALAGTIHYDVMEFIEPIFHVHGEAAVLFYRFFSTVLNPDGTVRSRTPWNCTEVFAKVDGRWRIVHTHWSFINGQREDGGV